MDINENPIYVLLNPAIIHSQKDLPISIYETGMLMFLSFNLFFLFLFRVFLSNIFISRLKELHVIDGNPQLIFVKSSYNIEVCIFIYETISGWQLSILD